MSRSALRMALAAALFVSAESAIAAEPATLFRLHCSGCHGADASGSRRGGIPPIPGIAGKLLNHREGRRYLANVPGLVNAALPDEKAADLLNYVLQKWDSANVPANSAPFTSTEIADLRSRPVEDIAALRARITADLLRAGIAVAY